jgi:gamma-glutamyltranspeptidase/glutathione hydrolase
MCPTIVLRDGRAVLALGGRGGRRIPNAVAAVLTGHVGRQQSVEDAVAAPRVHTEGGLRVILENGWREPDLAHLRRVGYAVERGPCAVIDAVAFEPRSRESRAASR